MDHCQVCQGTIEAIVRLDPVDVPEPYRLIASHDQSVQWLVRLHGWHYASFSEEEYTAERQVVLHGEVSWTEVVITTHPNSRFASGSCSDLEPDCGNRFQPKHPAFRVYNFDSNDESEFWSYRAMISMYIVQLYPIFHLPISLWRSGQYCLGWYWKHADFSRNVIFFYSDSKNIGPIANLTAAADCGTKTAQSAYWPCHDMIRTQILNMRESGRDHNPETRSGSNPSVNPLGIPLFRVTTLTERSSPVPNPDSSQVIRNHC
jgi:hypothetical protein